MQEASGTDQICQSLNMETVPVIMGEVCQCRSLNTSNIVAQGVAALPAVAGVSR
jgi:hypothetical protein